MRIKHLLISCIFTLFVMTAPLAHAAKINAEGAAELKNIFETMLSEQAAMAASDGETTLEKQGEVLVEEAGSYYAVTLPQLQVKHADGSKFKIGIISINALPHDKPNQWKMTIAMPTPMIAYDAQNNPTFRISINDQKAAGIFHSDVQQFSKLDAQYKDITIESSKRGGSTTIENVIARFNFGEDQNNTWSGPGYVELNNLKAQNTESVELTSIGQIKGVFTMDQWNPQAGRDYQKKFLALQEQGAFEGPDLSPEQAQELSAALLTLFTKGMNGFDGTYSISDLSVTKPAKDGKDAETIKINEAAFAFGMNGFLQDAVSLGLGVKYNGFDLSSMPTEDKEILPSALNFDVAINKIPFKQLVEIGQNTYSAAGNNPQQALQMAGLSLMLKVPAILSQAGTNIEFKDNMIGNALYNVDFNGTIIADITATNSATAKATMVFKGLNALLSKTRAISLNPNHERAEEMGRLSEQLEFLQSIGAPQDAGATHVFEFIMNPQGQMLLNGQDVKGLPQKPQSQP